MHAAVPHTIVVVGEPLPEQVLDTAVDPAEIAQQSFSTERRGFDQRQVQQYLRAVADSLHDAQQREADMRTRLGRAVRRAENAEHALRNAPEDDPAELNRELGDQVASVLEAARVAGEQRAAAAEKSASQIMANAKAEASRMRAEADSVLQDRRAEAETAATDILVNGQAEAQTLREQAKADAAATIATATDQLERARNECDALIHEAEEARAQILEDLERRRRQARAQVERLRVGRDRLLRSYEVVRRTLEETTLELKSSLNEAKVRGDGAARAITSEPLASREQLEAELRDAKMIGRITLSDPVTPTHENLSVAGVLRSPALPRSLDETQPTGTHATKDSPSAGPKAPASAPSLKASSVADADEDPIAAMMAAAEAKRVGSAAPEPTDLDEVVDPELAQLEDHDLNVVEPSDEIEEVVAVPVEGSTAGSTPNAEPAAKAPGLFDALRAQRPGRKRSARKTTEKNESTKTEPKKGAAKKSESTKTELTPVESKTEPKKGAANKTELTPVESKAEPKKGAANKNEPRKSEAEAGQPTRVEVVPSIEAQRDAVIADAAKQLEKRLKRALADEQNELLAGIRAAKKNIGLTNIVGDVDTHVNRYVVAIHEVAAVTYGAGAALVDVEAALGHLPAGAVEELLEADVVLPIRQRLASLDDLRVDVADMHIDPLRAFYRQRKTDHLGPAASRLANLLCVAGLCDALPEESALPWEPAAK